MISSLPAQSVVETMRFSGGEYVVKQGDHADALFLIMEGSVVCRRRGDEQKLLGRRRGRAAARFIVGGAVVLNLVGFVAFRGGRPQPLASTAQATILCYAERPRGLEGADPILYRRFCRLAPSRPPRWVEPTENPMSPRRRSLSDTDYREVAL